MQKKLTMLYFSPTGNTLRAAQYLAAGVAEQIEQIDLSLPQQNGSTYGEDALVLLAAPVFGGRLPALFLDRLAHFSSRNARAITVVVYGNRAYEDALLELNDAAAARGFQVVASAALLAEHSMVREVAAGRPDRQDKIQMHSFALQIIEKLKNGPNSTPDVPGNRPYKQWQKMPAVPLASPACIRCGLCAKRCPAGAIPAGQPNETNPQRCILCMRCVALCPQNARALPPQAEEAIRAKLAPVADIRRENELFL